LPPVVERRSAAIAAPQILAFIAACIVVPLAVERIYKLYSDVLTGPWSGREDQ
jgi:hypothetical protein